MKKPSVSYSIDIRNYYSSEGEVSKRCFFATHDFYPHPRLYPHPRPTTSTHDPRPTTVSYTHSLFARICILSATRRCYIHSDGNVNRAEKGISLFAIQHSSSFTTLDWHFLSCDFRLQIVLALYYSLTKRRINGNTFVKHHRERLFTHGRLYRLATR